MVKKYLIALLMLCAMGAQGAAYTSAASGFWSDPATWGGGGCPTNDGDSFTIQAAHTVTFNADLSSLPNGLGAGSISGILEFDVGVPAHMKMNANITGTGQWLMGASDDPITYTADNRPSVVIEQNGGTIQLSRAGAVQWYGMTNGFYGFITNTVSITGDNTNLFFAENVSNVASNDVIYIDNHNMRGVGGSLHMVYEVATNRITIWKAIPSWAGLVTNTWAGATIIGAVTTNNRTNGSFVVKLSRPIVVYQPSKLSNTALIASAGQSNILYGVRFSNCGRGANDGRNYFTFAGCTGAHNTGAGLSYGGAVHYFIGCVGVGNSGPLVSGPTTFGHVILGCVGVGHANGTMAAAAYSVLVENCVSRNYTYGLLNNCHSSVVRRCSGANAASGGLAYNSFDTRIQGCTNANADASGAVNVGSYHIWDTISIDAASQTVAKDICNSVIYSTNDYSSAVSLTVTRLTPWSPVVWNGTNFASSYGTVMLTNQSGVYAWAHQPTVAGQPVPYYVDVAVKPLSTRDVELGWYGKSDCYYAYGTAPGTGIPATLTALATGTGWQYGTVTLTNTLPVAQSFRLWVSMTNAVAATEGWTRVNLPTDYTVRVQ